MCDSGHLWSQMDLALEHLLQLGGGVVVEGGPGARRDGAGAGHLQCAAAVTRACRWNLALGHSRLHSKTYLKNSILAV